MMSFASFHVTLSVSGVLLTIDIAARGPDTPDFNSAAIRFASRSQIISSQTWLNKSRESILRQNLAFYGV